jgi:MarR family transcriptional regulator, lower aerobic nicotinate degradation pathway regulator
MMRRRETMGGCPPEWAGADASLDWTPMPEPLGRFTGFALSWVTDLNRQMFASAMAELDLLPAHPAILVLLMVEGPMVQARLSDRLRIDRATMVSLLNGLEAQGLVERRPHPTDRRAFEVHITEAGEARMEDIGHAATAVNNRFYGTLSPEEQQVFLTLLRRLATANTPRVPFTSDAPGNDTED